MGGGGVDEGVTHCQSRVCVLGPVFDIIMGGG